jgi:ElaB/YqjD/DUF883 family membrane-anchored ribosome-binding protein
MAHWARLGVQRSTFERGQGMTETATTGVGQVDRPTTEQAKEKVQETAGQVQQKALEAKGQAGERVRRELDTRSTEAGTQLGQTAEAMRRTGDQLREDGKETPAKVVTAVAERAERLGSYLTRADADQMIRDIENFARRQPFFVAVGGATVGFLASRFMKASSSRRYQGGSGSYRAGSASASRIDGSHELGQGSAGSSLSIGAGSNLSDDLTSSAASSKRGGSSGQSGN